MTPPVKLEKKNVGDIFSLTPLQEGMLFYFLQDPLGDMFFEQVSLQIGGSIDPVIFKAAWESVVDGNDMLRAVFRWQHVKRPVQVVLKTYRPDIRFTDFSTISDGEVESLYLDLLARDRREKFDLLSVPFRVNLCRVSGMDCRIVLSHHHILYDGWSTGVILEEFFGAYRQLSAGHAAKAAKEKMPFSGFVKWLDCLDLDGSKAFWERYMEGSCGDCSRERDVEKTTADFAEFEISLPSALRDSVESFVLRSKLTPAALYHAAWGLLMQRYEGRFDVVFDTTVAGRPPELEGAGDVVGLFINTIPCRVRTAPDDSVLDFLSRFKEELRERQAFENIPIHRLGLSFEERRGGVFRSLLVMENYPVDKRLAENACGLPVMSISNFGINDHDLTLLIKVVSGVEFQFIYHRSLFGASDIELIVAGYLELLEKIVSGPLDCVRDFLVSPGEETRMLKNITNNREALAGPLQSPDFLAPRTVTEARLRELFALVLRMDPLAIGIDDNFFQFGGHSLRASLLASRIQREFNVELPLIEVFQLKSIRNIAGYIECKAKECLVPVLKSERQEYYPLSSAQTRMFVLHQEEAVGTTYNIPRAFFVEGDLDAARLEDALRKLIRHHECLRTEFGIAGSQPVQMVRARVEFDLQRLEVADSTVDEVIQRYIQPFDLSRPPLLRAGLAGLDNNRYLLMIDIHHIVSDGFSNMLLLRDLIALYRGRRLPVLDLQYKDYAMWERRFKATASFNRQRQFWLDRFLPLPSELNFPSSKNPSSSGGFQGDVIYFDVDEELTAGIRLLASATGATVFNVMLAAYYVLLSKYTRQEDIVVGFPVTGRSREEFGHIAGMFVNMLPLRCFPRKDLPYEDFLSEVRDSTWQAMENQDYPFNELVLALGLSGDRVKNPLFKTAFTMHDMNRGAGDLDSIDLDELSLAEEPRIRLAPYNFNRDVAAFEFHMVAREKKHAIEMFFDFSLNVISRETAENIIQHYRDVLENVVRNRRITALQIEIPVGFEMVSSSRLRAELEDFDF